MFTDDDGARCFASKLSKNLCALAIKPLAEPDVWRNRFRPPIVFNASIFADIAHEIIVILREAKLQRSPERFRGEARLSISDCSQQQPGRKTGSKPKMFESLASC